MSELPEGVRAAIFDLSGTVIDHGSRGPVIAFVELFARHGVAITEQEARRPMGAHKLDHIWAMLSDPSVAERWAQANGATPDRAVLDKLYAEFTPLQIEVLERHCEVLPGVPEVTSELTRRGIRFASTTGFDTGMMAGLIRSANANGYNPEIFVGPDLVGGGRPAPWMAHYAARHMGVYPMRTFVKVGDTPADIAEAQNAGMWAVSIVVTGNEIGLSKEQLDAVPETVKQELFAAARSKFESLGAHYVIDATADLLPVIDAINERIARGERP
jgi:phosphonoacetaldehyde hydrolase